MILRCCTPSRRARVTAAALASMLVTTMLTLAAAPSPAATPDPILEVPAVLETTPSEATGDSMDDPAIWVDPVDPSRSVVIGADHADGSLTVYDLAGERLQRLPRDRANNVDLRPGFLLGGVTVPVLGVAGGHRIS